MATLVELGPDDVLVVRLDRGPDEGEPEMLASVRELLGIRAILVMQPGMEISSLPADEVLRALARPDLPG